MGRRDAGSRRRLLFQASRGKRWLVIVATAFGTVGVVAVALAMSGGEPGATSHASAPSPTARVSPGQSGRLGAPPSTTEGRANGSSATADSIATGSGSGGNQPSARPSSPFPTAFDVSARFGSDCVRPGERQTITITTLPTIGVVYHAQYSDGKNALDPGYYGGNNGGVTDDEGRWTDSWVVGAGAPPGRVRVDVAAQGNDGRGYTLVFFNVADATGKCPS